ncbi:hypothetical protein SAMN02910447_00932 [Ruminococcus sp. YE71]|uniref:TRAFAC clade GTPase domain-containing protein n=1 Tax=unclassified Ruminococcus TaxID=2608920 RepID=UPI0008817C02|nr:MULTISPECIES: hypothetical protein [unclassified Ruminococcus]SDA15454.1 hypothetical protein SAMN02910446_00931 [Ruminococcus sp. YE78]SFW22570.1 hypothetical protein SAMN02910447_00932 [Ruminococcus sp. YE71]
MGLFDFDKVICPYCYNKFPKSQIMWRCNSGKCIRPAALEEDSVYAEYHNITNPAEKRKPHIIPDPKPKKGFVKCDKCGDDTNMQICPVCHSVLPKTDENIVISVIGVPGSGKSYYVGTLIRQLRQYMSAFGCSIKFTTDESRRMYEDRFETPFSKRIVLPKTKQPDENANIVGANLPILCDITDDRLKTRTFTFFDAAGENFENEAIMRYVAPYISHSAAIILLLDPTQIPAVANTLVSENPNGVSGRRSVNTVSYEQVLNNTVEVIHSHLKSKGQIDIPLAVGFSKWDLIENSPTLRPDGVITNPSPHFMRGFSEEDCDNVSSEVEGLLAHWECQNFVMLARQQFKTVKFFGFSAIGADIETGRSVPNIVSKRVEDPFLWLLHKKKIII